MIFSLKKRENHPTKKDEKDDVDLPFFKRENQSKKKSQDPFF
jgi:hypothetical protein